MKQELFRMERVTYRENELTMLEDFNLRIDQGEILGLLPLNGQGLPAFLKLLETNLPLFDGYVYYGGERINSWKESRRNPNRISIIGSESRLVDALNGTDNIFVLRQGFRQEFLRTGLLQRQIQPFLEDIGMEIPMDLPAERLSAFERVVLELLRAVVLGHRLIVFHEIGMMISSQELEKLHAILRRYAARGFSFLYICPHFEEVGRICRRCALLSHGRILKTIPCDGMADEVLKLYTSGYERMVRGRLEQIREEKAEKEIMRIRGLNGTAIRNFSLEIRKGECLALQLLDNASFLELCAFLKGERKPESGELWADGRWQSFRAGHFGAVISERATKTMLFPELTYMENLCISLSGRIPSLWRKRSIQRSIQKEYGPILGEDVFSVPVEELTERQKYQLIYARILLARPDVAFCIQPFKSADLAHRMVIWQMLERLLEQGIAVVILALSLSDSLSLADRLVVYGREERREILRKDFSTISEVAPWLFLYATSQPAEASKAPGRSFVGVPPGED